MVPTVRKRAFCSSIHESRLSPPLVRCASYWTTRVGDLSAFPRIKKGRNDGSHYCPHTALVLGGDECDVEAEAVLEDASADCNVEAVIKDAGADCNVEAAVCWRMPVLTAQ